MDRLSEPEVTSLLDQIAYINTPYEDYLALIAPVMLTANIVSVIMVQRYLDKKKAPKTTDFESRIMYD